MGVLVDCTLNSLLEIVNYSKRLKYYETNEIPKINGSFEIFQAFALLCYYHYNLKIRSYEIEFHLIGIHLHICDFTIHIFEIGFIFRKYYFNKLKFNLS